MKQKITITNQNGKYGITAENGEIICQPHYDHIRFVERHNSYIVKKDNRYGVLDSDGTVIAEPVYQHIAPYKDRPSDNKMGKGYQTVQPTGLGWLSVDGKEILPPRFAEYRRVNNFILAKPDNSIYEQVYTAEGKIVDLSEKIYVSDLENNYTEISDSSKDQIIILDSEGKPYATFADRDLYISAFAPGKPIAAKKKYGQFWGFLGTRGEVIIDYQFETLYTDFEIPFIQKYTRVGIGGKVGVIDENGQFVIPIEYRSLSSPQENDIYYMSDGTNGYLDYHNNRYILQFDENENKFFYKDQNGNDGHIAHVEDVLPLIENSICATHQDKWGMIDGKNNVIVPVIYDEISPTFCGTLAFVKKDGKYAFIHREKGLITDFIYDDAFFLMKDYGLGVINGLYALIAPEGQITDARFSEIGTPVPDVFYNYDDNEIPACGGIWDYAVFPTKNLFTTKDYEETISEDYNNFTQLNAPDKYSQQAYFKAFDAVDNRFVMILQDGTIQNLPVCLAKTDPVFNMHVPKPSLKENNLPSYILKQKIVGAKNKISPKYTSVDDFYYIQGYHSKTLKALQGYTNRFYHTLGIAVSYWIMARLHNDTDKYINLQYMYDRLYASYLCAIDPDLIRIEQLVDDWLMTDNEPVDDIIASNTLNANEQTSLYVLRKLCYLHSSILRYASNTSLRYYSEITELIVLAKMVLPSSQKAKFDNWLEEKLEQGKRRYTSTVTNENTPYGTYYLYADEFVPLAFFFDDNFDEDFVSSPEFLKTLLDEVNWDENPYLIKIDDMFFT